MGTRDLPTTLLVDLVYTGTVQVLENSVFVRFELIKCMILSMNTMYQSCHARRECPLVLDHFTTIPDGGLYFDARKIFNGDSVGAYHNLPQPGGWKSCA